jgi:hypothetical protein
MFRCLHSGIRLAGIRLVIAAALLAGALPLHAQLRTAQLVEDSAVRKPLSVVLSKSGTREVCDAGATWLRLGVQSLQLAGSDSLTVTSSGGDVATFSGTRWNGRSFHTRALRGDCLTIEATFAEGSSRFEAEDYDAGTLPLGESTAVLAGAGDICDYTPVDCRRTSDLVVGMNPTAAFASGDNVYNSGTLAQYNERYDPNWGRFKELTLPVPGNHEYWTSGAAGYFDYFNGVGVQSGPAGDRGNGWWSVDVGDWHVIGLNTRSNGTSSTAQLAWLDADLAANTKPCTAAIFHHPLVSVGEYTGYSGVKPIWDRLYAAKADLVVVGHDHNYQRYAPMDGTQAARADGLVQLIVGTGGANLYAETMRTHPQLLVSQASTMGVLALTLSPLRYEGRFVPVAGATWSDSFGAACHNALVQEEPDEGDFGLSSTTTMAMEPGHSGGKWINVASLDGFSAPVSLAVSGLPSGVTGSFGTNPITPPADGTTRSLLTLRASTSAVAGTYTVTVTGTAGALSHTTSFRLTVRSL